MANLKAGRVADMANSMAAAIEQAMQDEWLVVKGHPLPGPAGEVDRQILFVAVARGVLRYLHEHRTEIATTAVLGDVAHEHTLDFTYE